MKYVEALDQYVREPGEVSLFLGGGITNCVNWQNLVIESLKDTDLVLLNPRRKNFPMGDPEATPKQIVWEYEHMKLATMIMFWFSPETLCPITLFELGKWIEKDKQLFVGCDPAYQRMQDVIVQCSLSRPTLKVHTSLESIVAAIKNSLKDASWH